MADESSVNQSIIDEVDSSNIQADQMEGESGVIRSIIDELPRGDIKGDQMGGKRGFTQRIYHELHSWISKKIKRKVKVVLLEVLLITLFFGYPRRSNGR